MDKIFHHIRNAPDARTPGDIVFRSPSVATPQVHRFLPATAGFLYVHTVPGHLAAEKFRWRLVSTPDPALFVQGTDLPTSSGLPWAVPFPAVTCRERYLPLRACLVGEGILRGQDMTRWAKLRVDARAQVVYRSGPPLLVNFAACSALKFRVAEGVGLHYVRLSKFAAAKRDGGLDPLLGRSACPVHSKTELCVGAAQLALEHQPDSAAFALRILRVLRPIIPNPSVPPCLRLCGVRAHTRPPVEGGLLMHWIGSLDCPRLRLLHVHKPAYRALRFLMPDEDKIALECELGLDNETSAMDSMKGCTQLWVIPTAIHVSRGLCIMRIDDIEQREDCNSDLAKWTIQGQLWTLYPTSRAP